MRLVMLPLLLAVALPARAADELTVLPVNGEVPPARILRTALHAAAKTHFDARRETVASLKTPDDLRKRQRELRERFIQALGGFPEKTPLNARVVGQLKRDGYRIEKVIYESRPGHAITANIYLPDGSPRAPGVLMPIGHSVTGKAAEYIQRGAVLLVKHGFVVLTYDPIGQGERRQLLDDGKAVLPASTNEHTMVGVGALLVGRSTASYRVWDGIRSLDYLASRPEVDPRVLGCTGCSGGGTMTSYLMALDDRIRAAAPSCYITSLERLFATIGPQDAEQNVPGQVAFGMEHADYLTMRAPRATLIAAATRDFFDIGGTWTSFREAKRLYGLMGHPERIDLMESDTTHGFPKPQREAVLRFMRRWLQGIDDAPTEPDFPIEKEQDLWCTRTGQVLEDLKGKSAFDLNAERLTERERQRPASREPAELRKEVARLIGLRLPVPAARVKEVGVVPRASYTIRKLVFETEPGVLVPGLLFDPGKETALTLYVHGDGKAAELAALEKRAQAGERILAVDLRGLGETAPGKAGRPNLFGADFHEAFVALHLNRPLLGQRVHDLLAVVGALKYGPVHLTGVGSAGPIALHAAALEPERIAQLTLERSLASWALVVRTPVSHNQLTNVVFGALTVYDLPDLEKLVSPRPLTVRDRVGPTGLVLSPGSR